MKIAWKTLIMVAGVALLAVPAWLHPRPLLIWNASASVPIGFYKVTPGPATKVGDLVAVKPPPPLADFLARRGYLPEGLPLLKRIAAGAGGVVCRGGAKVTIDDAAVALALSHDRRGRPLPVWRGCVRLGDSQVFLLNRGVPDSLDGRYFGPIDVSRIIGRARPIWTETER